MLCVFLLPWDQLFAREPVNVSVIQHISLYRTYCQLKLQQQHPKKEKSEQKDQKESKNVKKVPDSKPDLSKKNGSPSITRPKGKTMPKGTGKTTGASGQKSHNFRWPL